MMEEERPFTSLYTITLPVAYPNYLQSGGCDPQCGLPANRGLRQLRESIHCGTVSSRIVHSVRIGPPQPKTALLQ
jgi:hypothetical protein